MAAPVIAQMPKPNERLIGEPANILKLTRDTKDVFNQKYEDANFDSDLVVTKIESKIYDLSDKTDNKAYTEAKQKIYVGMNKGEILLLCADKQFVQSETVQPTWVAHLEWAETEIIKTKK